jgi:hypothetical protein
MQTLTFNTGRAYTEHGQRIAAAKLESGPIVMVDIDRDIDYVFCAPTMLTQAAIMREYDHNLNIAPHDAGISYEEYYAILKQLRAAAAEVKCI